VADYFNDDTHVAGYEIINEPWPGSPWLQTAFGSPAFDTGELTPFYDQVDSAIRAVDPSTPVLFEPNTLFNQGVPTSLGAVDEPHTVFAFHNYCAESFLSELLCPLIDDTIMGNAADYADSHDIPAMITEFGSANGSTAIADTLHAADAHHYGWLQWSYNGEPSITGTSPEAALVFDTHQPPVGDNVDTDRLAVSAAPYPQTVAGTPDTWSFDRDTDTFEFSYSTEKADGSGDFDAGAQTTISVPAINYPHGYHVEVTGGHVVSDSAPDLVIASNGGADTVTVVVRPAGT
jgi:endoglycosylceramidase